MLALPKCATIQESRLIREFCFYYSIGRQIKVGLCQLSISYIE
ncbi:MAG TPA: hypothetical protein VF607_02415 [Verrucomicrobiae bacterium]